MKSTPAGREVKLITDSTSAVTVAVHSPSKRKNLHPGLALDAELATGGPLSYVYGHSGAPEHALVDRFASVAPHGRMEYQLVKP